MVLRVITSGLLLISVLFWPYYVSVAIFLFGAFYFKFYTEGVLLFLISDLMHASPEARFAQFLFVSGYVSLFCLVGIELLKKKLRFYQE